MPQISTQVQESEVAGRKIVDVVEYAVDIPWRHPEPLRQCRGVLIHRRCRHQRAARVGVVRAVQHQRRELAVDFASVEGTAFGGTGRDDEVVAAPRMVRTRVSVRLQGPSEFGRGECYGVLVLTDFVRERVLKRSDRLAQLLKQRILRAELRAVSIESAELAEEYLAIHAQRLLNADDLGNRLKLLPDERRWKDAL